MTFWSTGCKNIWLQPQFNKVYDLFKNDDITFWSVTSGKLEDLSEFIDECEKWLDLELKRLKIPAKLSRRILLRQNVFFNSIEENFQKEGDYFSFKQQIKSIGSPSRFRPPKVEKKNSEDQASKQLKVKKNPL